MEKKLGGQEQAYLKRERDKMKNYDDFEYLECWNCGGEGGTTGDELVMEDPLWYDEDDFRVCDVCRGKGIIKIKNK